MFKLSNAETFIWPVEVILPVDGGKYEKQTFDAIFKHLGQSQIKEMLEAEGANDISFAKQILVGWKGITDDGKNEVPFSETQKEKLLDIPVVAGAVTSAFLNAKTGGEAKRKN